MPKGGLRLIVVEVKSGGSPGSTRGLDVFKHRFGVEVVTIVVGIGGMELREFLESELVRW